MDRREICDFLAILEDVTLLSVLRDKISDLKGKVYSQANVAKETGFEERLKVASQERYSSSVSNAVLRARLWEGIQSGLDLAPVLPFSTRVANNCATGAAQSAADIIGGSLTDAPDNQDLWSKAKGAWTQAVRLFGRDRQDFSDVVGMQASRLVAEAARKGLLDPGQRAELADAIRRRLNELPPELRDETATKAAMEGDISALTLLATGTSLASIVIAVDMAGFSAYILAAQASAIIPMLGGKAAVSALFVLSNPLFLILVLGGGSVWAHQHFNSSIRSRLAASLTMLLALRGIAEGRNGLKSCLDDFKAMLDLSSSVVSPEQSASYERQYSAITKLLAHPLPETPGKATGVLSRPLDEAQTDPLAELLFPDEATSGKEAFAVASLTLGDVVYNAAAIDPAVISAADFSRTEDLDDIFAFGSFAERISEMSDGALTGAESNLRGYVAEQMVAARLVEQGHQVSLPEASNTPGYDLLIDGSPFQVKCLKDLGGLSQHFEKYPDIPVIASSNLALEIEGYSAPWADKVYFVEGYDYETIDLIMQSSIDAGASLNNLDTPYFAMAVSAAKNIHGWWKGTVSLSDLPFEVAMDGAIKGGLAVSGGFAGKGLGLLLFGPAGAVVFGGVGAIGALVGAGWTKRELHKLVAKEWVGNVDNAVRRFRVALRHALANKLEIARKKIELLSEQKGMESEWIRLKLWDEALAIAEKIHSLDTQSHHEDPVEAACQYLKLMHDGCVHPWQVAEELGQLLNVLKTKPTVREGLSWIVNRTGEMFTSTKDKWES